MPHCTFYYQVLSYSWETRLTIFEHVVLTCTKLVLMNVLGLDRYLLEIVITKVRIFTSLPALRLLFFFVMHYTYMSRLSLLQSTWWLKIEDIYHSIMWHISSRSIIFKHSMLKLWQNSNRILYQLWLTHYLPILVDYFSTNSGRFSHNNDIYPPNLVNLY